MKLREVKKQKLFEKIIFNFEKKNLIPNAT